MKNWPKLLIINNLIFFTFIFVGFGCKPAESEEEYVAIVGDSKLTKKQVENELRGLPLNPKYEKEFINEWIETEILYQTAIKNNIVNRKDFNFIIEKTKKELAASLAIQEYINSHPIQISQAELEDYFFKNRKNFEFSDDAYVLNLVSFKEEDKAIDYRNFALNQGWGKALSNLNDSIIIENNQNKIYQLSHIQSKKIIRVLGELLLNEISPIIKTEQENFIIVQLISKIEKNTVPEFKFISEQVEKIYRIQKQRELIRTYISQLLSEEKVKIY